MTDRLKSSGGLATVLLLTSTVIFGVEKEPFITFTIKGGRTVMDVMVEIDQTNAARIHETRMLKEKEIIRYQTVLTEHERAEFEARIQKSNFFEAEDKKEIRYTYKHAGISTLSISLDGKRHSKTYQHEPDLAPVEQMLWQLIFQARALHSLRPDGDARLSGGDVLQPDAMKAPLKKYIRTHDDWGDTKAALESLSRVTTAREFHDFVVNGLKVDAAERDTLLGIIGTHLFRSNIPRGHLETLFPVYLDYVKGAGIPPRLEGVESEAFDQFMRVLGYWHYEDAIPFLIKGFEARTKPGVTTYQTPLASMGLAGLKAVFPFLSSQLPAHRANATELLVIASRTGPNCGFANPVPESEYQKMKPYFEDTVLPKLTSLAEEDPAVKEAIEEIRSWMAK